MSKRRVLARLFVMVLTSVTLSACNPNSSAPDQRTGKSPEVDTGKGGAPSSQCPTSSPSEIKAGLVARYAYRELTKCKLSEEEFLAISDKW
jgi:hypothetical protein